MLSLIFVSFVMFPFQQWTKYSANVSGSANPHDLEEWISRKSGGDGNEIAYCFTEL